MSRKRHTPAIWVAFNKRGRGGGGATVVGRPLGLGPGQVCTASTTVLGDGGVRVASTLIIYLLNPYNVAGTHPNARRKAQKAPKIERERREGKREGDRERDG